MQFKSHANRNAYANKEIQYDAIAICISDIYIYIIHIYHICNTTYVNAEIFSQLGITMASDDLTQDDYRMTPRVFYSRLPWHHQPYDLLVRFT